jgi:hypothetical protein
MDHKDILTQCAMTVNVRNVSYGDVDDMFANAAQIASLITGRKFTKYEITTVMEAVKLARRRVNPLLDDNYIDSINYTSFSGQFAHEAYGGTHSTKEDEELVALAKRFSPQTKKDDVNAKLTVKFDGNHTAVVQPGISK